MSYNLKNMKAEFKAKGIFYTPPELALYLKSLVDVDVAEVYDPTCGDGSLLSVFGDDVKKFGQEINQHQLDVASGRLTNFHGFCGDTLANPAWLDKRFDVIVANPPFSIKWTQASDERFSKSPALPPPSRADYAFILHCLHMLSDSGVAVILSAPGVLYRGQSEAKIRQWLVTQNYIDSVIEIQGDSFVDTSIQTCVLVLRKNKTTTDIVFKKRATGESKTVSFSDIKDNDFCLSVNQFIPEPEPKRELIDAVALQLEIRREASKALNAAINHDRFICELEPNLNHRDFISQLNKIIADQGELI